MGWPEALDKQEQMGGKIHVEDDNTNNVLCRSVGYDYYPQVSYFDFVQVWMNMDRDVEAKFCRVCLNTAVRRLARSR